MLYQAYLKPGCDAEYQEAWNTVASYFIKERGALGSCLHRAADGMWVAYSRWSDKASWSASWPENLDIHSKGLPREITDAVLTIKNCLDPDLPQSSLELEIVSDLLLKP